ncbi:LacI family transcriptional regulator [Nakamurella endophytica]|uniref:LacI family transcriptional regulator n=1 Tax=Nakamurella endophytica TaxID=1748367 RepID=A0A917T8R1_9ACTN|nr:LacI family transcriptional regulator [Nakamurella endophytica]
MADVAREAGVSVASVSRVLNGHPARPGTADRIRKAAAELGYLPDLAARSLKMRRTEQVSLVVDDLGNPAYIDMMRGVERVLRDAGYRLQISAIGSDADLGTSTALHTVSRGYADGLIICPLRINAELVQVLEASPIPVVVIGTLPRGARLDNVTVDSSSGVRLALEHLHGLGRRRVAFLGGPVDTNPGTRRLAGFRTAARALGLPGDPELESVTDAWTYEAALTAFDRLLGRTDFDALLAANDVLAIAAMHTLHRRGRRVPQDVAVVGVDDSEVTAFSTPTLTSVALGAQRRGAMAARLLLRRLADPEAPLRRLREVPRLQVRESTTGSAEPVGAGHPTAQPSTAAADPHAGPAEQEHR